MWIKSKQFKDNLVETDRKVALTYDIAGNFSFMAYYWQDEGYPIETVSEAVNRDYCGCDKCLSGRLVWICGNVD